jgi:phosphoribosyl-ATP pyrophosphohydrolase/phosphoribosyl-AMP cyclohydrolase
MQIEALKWDADGLVTVVVQDRMTGEIRMLAHANREAVQATLETGYAHFYSRSRKQPWRKGETSGHGLRVAEVWADCDADALIYLADADGPSCHTLRETCFFQRVTGAGADAAASATAGHARPALPQLWAELEARRSAPADTSYTRKLLDEGVDKIGAKVEEEGNELSRALRGESDERVISEAADLTYHMLVGLQARGLSLRQLETELARRFGVSGLAEKAARTR